MKSLFLTILFFIAVSYAYPQGSLIKSSQSGHYTYIYRLSDQECFTIALKSKSAINDSYFHTLIDSFYNDSHTNYKGKLPFGNYLYVTPVKNQMIYRLVTIQNVQLDFINDRKNLQFTLTDLKGKEITDAEVEIGKGKRIKYDQQAHLYLAKSTPKQKIIKVNYQQVNNCFNFNDEPDRYEPFLRNRYVSPVNMRKELLYKGYMVFNKPIYKPLDTVKFKTYLVTSSGQAIRNKELRIELGKAGDKNGKVISVIKPYHDGGYSADLVLADSLNMTLDSEYDLILKELIGNDWKEVYRGNFLYEDYELKAIQFSARTDKEEYSPGNPVTVYLKASDENGLAVPDGRVEVKVLNNYASNYRSNHLFIPDSLWSTQLKLDPIGETKLVLPDSIFPRADLNFHLEFRLLNSSNENQTASKYLKYVYKSVKIKASFKKDNLNFIYLQNGKEQVQKAKLISYFKDWEKADSSMVELPFSLKADSRIADYVIETEDGYKEDIELKSIRPSMAVLAVRTKDSL